MIAVALACCGAVALALSSVAPASPSPEVRALTARFSRALSSVRSFRIVLTSPMGMTATVTMQTREQRMRTVMAIGPFVTETIVAGGRGYARTNGGPWRLQDSTTSTTSVRRAGAGLMAQVMSGMHLHLLPDRRENGRLIGVYEVVTVPPPGAPASAHALTMTCTYDKATSLPLTCANAFVTETFGGWNDPHNRIDVPIVTAPTQSPIFFPTPTPAASPSPAALPSPIESPTPAAMPSASPLALPSASAPASPSA